MFSTFLYKTHKSEALGLEYVPKILKTLYIFKQIYYNYLDRKIVSRFRYAKSAERFPSRTKAHPLALSDAKHFTIYGRVNNAEK